MPTAQPSVGATLPGVGLNTIPYPISWSLSSEKRTFAVLMFN